MGNTYRNRPKYQVGDIIEEYYYDVETKKGVIDTFMIMAIEYKIRKLIYRVTYRHVKKKGNPYYYRSKMTWHYTMRNMLTGEMESTTCRSIDKGAATKKIG
jgi:hypothetical protein